MAYSYGNNVSKVTGTAKHIGHDRQDRILKRLPKAIKNLVMYELTGDYSLLSIEKAVKKYGTNETISRIREIIRKDTIAIYGKDHPNAS